MVLSFEDSPIFDWYKKNRIFILFLIIIVFGGNAYLYFAPGMAKENNAKEWTRFQTRTAEIDLKENFAAQISAAKDDAITFPWFLYTATRAALQSNNETALGLLKNELLALDASYQLRFKARLFDSPLDYDPLVPMQGGISFYHHTPS